MRKPVIVTHRIGSARWRAQPARIAVLSDLHVIAPWTSLTLLAAVVDRINALRPDVVLLPGDFLADPKLGPKRATAREIVAVLDGLRAPLGCHATLGNHDWKDCPDAKSSGGVRNSVVEALGNSSIHHYANAARDLGPFWLAGLDSMQGLGTTRNPKPRHDLKAALGDVPQGADTILMAHEPDLWAFERPDVALTVSGHTHGGQMVIGNWRPLTPSRFGGRFALGLHRDGDRALVVSGGLGYTALPIRIGVPPEITMIELTGA